MKYHLIINPTEEESVTVVAHAPSELTARIEDLVLSYTGKNTISAKGEDDLTELSFDDVECITVIDRKTVAITKDGRQYRLRSSLCDLEAILPSYFIRINKSAIANENRIARFHTVYNGSVDAVFRCGYRDYVSRRCFAEIKRRFQSK